MSAALVSSRFRRSCQWTGQARQAKNQLYGGITISGLLVAASGYSRTSGSATVNTLPFAAPFASLALWVRREQHFTLGLSTLEGVMHQVHLDAHQQRTIANATQKRIHFGHGECASKSPAVQVIFRLVHRQKAKRASERFFAKQCCRPSYTPHPGTKE